MTYDESLALVVLMEECSEVQKCCSKILRFGPNNVHRKKHYTHRELLIEELGDVLALVGIAMEVLDITEQDVIYLATKRLEREKLDHPEWFKKVEENET